jgi:DMSO/TMAO reductase YedYZ heme-binding membrane subunit
VNWLWFLIRGSGIGAIVLMSASVMWGLMVSSKVFGRAIKARGLTWLHESLSISAIFAIVVHVVAVSRDDFIKFTWPELLVPGMSEWEPIAAAFGVMSFWTTLIVALCFYIKKRFGQWNWRRLHFLSFGAFGAGIAHAVMGGTDIDSPWVAGLYAGVVVGVLLLTAIRMVGGSATKPARAIPSRPPASVKSS